MSKISIKLTPSHVVLGLLLDTGTKEFRIEHLNTTSSAGVEQHYTTINNILVVLLNVKPQKIIIEKPYIKLHGGLNTTPQELIDRIEVIQTIYQVLKWEITTKLHIKPIEALPIDYRGKYAHLKKYELLEHARALFDPSMATNEILSHLDASMLLTYLEKQC